MIKLEKIHKDDRGEIYILLGDLKEHKEITLFSTNKDFARGGCIHKLNDEFNTVLEGKIHYFIGDNKFILSKGESIKIPRNTPHYFISLTDSLVVEWGCTPEEKVEKHKPFRDIVDDINKKVKR
jgi:mannose-6-phosphate isomerase-like protein (cupin superfamily)